MFLREVKAAKGYTYLRLVENYRVADKVKQRVILHLGRKDLLAPTVRPPVRGAGASGQSVTGATHGVTGWRQAG